MKINIGKNEAYIKLSLQDDSVVCSYGYDIDNPEGGFDVDNPDHEFLGNFLCLIAGLSTSLRDDMEGLINLGADAITFGEFDVGASNPSITQDFMNGLSEDDEELLNIPTVGGKQ